MVTCFPQDMFLHFIAKEHKYREAKNRELQYALR